MFLERMHDPWWADEKGLRLAYFGAALTPAGTESVDGKAVDVTPDGHLVVHADEGGLRTFAAGDVIHLR
jgi:hypothetical protein